MRNDEDMRKPAENRNCNGNGVAVAVLSYNIATNLTTNFDVFPDGATACPIGVGTPVAQALACLLDDGFEIISNVAAADITSGTAGDALGHYTLIKRR